jgi:hypothetical protein
MPFQKGNKANPGGRPKKSWIKDRERMREAQATWKKLLQVRDDMVLERKEVGKFPNGDPIIADVVPSVRDYLFCCKQILDRSVGLPRQEIELTGDPDKPLHVTSEFDFGKYNQLFTDVGKVGGNGTAVLNGNGTEKSVHSTHADSETGDLP